MNALGDTLPGMTTAGIILAGGHSTRMGSPKALLEWHGSTLAYRAAAIVARSVDGPVVMVRSAGQKLPRLPSGVLVVDDDRDGQGPLQGIATGLAAVQGAADAAYVSSVDTPFLAPDFVEWVVASLAPGVDIAVPHVGGYRHPLAACYRTSVLPVAEALLDGGLPKPALLFERCATRWLDDAAAREVDPTLQSLRNLNDTAEYAAARSEVPPPVFVTRHDHGAEVMEVEAFTLAAAASAAEVDLDTSALVFLNSSPVAADPELALVADDIITFPRPPNS
jgi:molybdenum cofactor guanylyltransferase